jgi:hypothetical protein
VANAATKNARTLQGSATNAAGATTTGSGLDLSTALGMVIEGRISNGDPGPTDPCEFVVQISRDGSSWHEFSRQRADIDANETYQFTVELPTPVMHVRTVFEGNTGEAVTVEAHGHELTSIG